MRMLEDHHLKEGGGTNFGYLLGHKICSEVER